MYCHSCGKQIEKDVKFCSHCGASSSNLKDTPDQSQAPQEVAMNMNPESSKPVLVCAFGLLAAFFMPWVQFFGTGLSGYNLGQLGSYGNYAWVIPILAGATILLSFTGVNNRGIGAIAGIVPLGAILYGLIRLGGEGGGGATKSVLDMAGQVLSIGAWLTIIFSIAIIIAAVVQKGQQQYTSPVQRPQTIQAPSRSFNEQIAPVTATDVKPSSEAEKKKFILQLCLSVGIILLLAAAYRATDQQLSFSDINHTEVWVFYASTVMTLCIATVLLLRQGNWSIESKKNEFKGEERSMENKNGPMIGIGIVGFLIGGFVGFLARPSTFMGGQLPFEHVISQGANLKGMNQMLVPIAQQSFNITLIGAIIGAIAGIVIGYFVVGKKKAI